MADMYILLKKYKNWKIGVDIIDDPYLKSDPDLDDIDIYLEKFFLINLFELF